MYKSLILIASSLLFISCKNQLKDEPKGLYVDYLGLEPESITLFADQIPKQDRNIRFGQELTIQIDGIDDFEKSENGKVLFGGEVSVVDSLNKVLFYVPDYFQKYDLVGVNPQDAKSLKLNLIIGKPLLPGNTFRYLFRIWDKKSHKELKGTLYLDVI